MTDQTDHQTDHQTTTANNQASGQGTQATHSLDPAAYWKLKAMVLQQQATHLRARQTMAEADASLQNAIQESGLPTGSFNYRLFDTDCTVRVEPTAGVKV